MRKAFSLILLSILILFSFTACDNGGSSSAVESYKAKSTKTYSVNLDLGLPAGVSKSISATPRDVLITIAYSKYKATPLFSYTDFGTPQGSTNGQFVDFEVGGRYTFAQGTWKIEVEAFSSTDVQLYEGAVTVYINSAVSEVQIPLNALVGDGAVSIEVTVPKLSSGGGIMTLEYGLYGSNSTTPVDLTRTVNGDKLVFSKTISNIPAGNYVFSFLFGDGELDFYYAETILAAVVANMTTAVDGDIPAGQLLIAGETKAFNGNLNQSICFVSADTASTYVWYVDGQQVQSSSDRVFLFTPTSSTTYNIECRLNGSSESSQIAKATLDARTAITLTLHLHGSIRQVMTYSGLTSVSDLDTYLSDKYDGNWYTAAENGSGGGGSVYSGANPFTADTELWAHRKCYTVTFNSNGSTQSTRKVYHNETVTTVNGAYIALPTPTRNQYTFMGWFTDTNYTTQVTDNTTITGNVTYYAYWLKTNSELCTVTFQTGTRTTGSVLIFISTETYSQPTTVLTVTVKKGEKVSIPSIDPETGSALDAWYSSYKAGTNLWGSGNNGPSNPYDFDTAVNSNLTLYGVWQEGDFLVTFNSQGGSSVGNQGATSGDKLLIPADPTRSGYIFGGWYKEAACTNKWDFDTDTVTGARTLYALWYQEKSYIENTSTSGGYIDTGYLASDSTKMIIDFDYTGSADSVLIGSEGPDFKIGTYKKTRLFQCTYNGTVMRSTGLLYTSGRQTLSFQVQDGFVIGNNHYGTPTPGNITSTDTIKVFRSASVSATAVGKCYGVKIYSSNNLVRDLVPVKRASDNVAGLYDQVNDVFYPSLGEDFSTN
ncbi:MAG: InlB B-repeat-containing protein [Spirochaetia bacterium]|nr:InlB B-repeat-containing protein [Spirochaetia bacterium]